MHHPSSSPCHIATLCYTMTMEQERNKLSINGGNIIIERGKRIKMAAGMGLTESSRGRHWRQALRRRLLTEKASYYCSKMVEKNNTVLENEASKEAEDEGNSNGFGNGNGDGNDSNYDDDDDDDDDDDGVVEEIERRIRALKRLIPGGEGLGMERLFEETAHYIEALEGQVTTMRALATFLDGLHKERRLLHG